MQTIPKFEDFIKDKLPKRNYSDSDWREHTVEYLIAHILFKSGVTKMEFGENGLYKKVVFSSLMIDKFIPVIYKDNDWSWEREMPLFWALLTASGIQYGGGAGNEPNPYTQACISGAKIKAYNPNVKIGRAYRIEASTDKEFMKNIFCYFYQLKNSQ